MGEAKPLPQRSALRPRPSETKAKTKTKTRSKENQELRVHARASPWEVPQGYDHTALSQQSELLRDDDLHTIALVLAC